MAERDFTFAGFSAPGYTQVPDEFFDICLRHLSGAETKVICYLFRRTFGWKKDSDAVSLSQITDGIVRRDGTRLDGGAGVSRETATTALKGLEQKGLIVRERQTRADGGTGTTVYRIHFRGESGNPTPPVKKPDQGGSGDPTPLIQRSDSPPVGSDDPQDPGSTRKQQTPDKDTWVSVRTRLSPQFSRSNWETYLEPLQLDSVAGSRARLIAPSDFVADWVRNRFATSLNAAFSEVLGRSIRVEIVT